MIRKCIIYLVILGLLLFSACSDTEQAPETSAIVIESETADETTAEQQLFEPETQDELFDYVIEKWRRGEAQDLYEYADSEIKTLLTAEDFACLFDSVSEISGDLQEITEIKSSKEDGIVTYTAVLNFDNLDSDIALSFKGMELCAFYRNVYFKGTFEIDRGDYSERYFILENDGCQLNAVYTCVDDGKVHPSVLLIPGSGPSDYNATVGILTPFEDIARGLAENGINSLRIDKRTLNYADEFGQEGGIDEEYMSDCQAAINYLKKQNISDLYLLGHSLGGQIATELAVTDREIDGLILFNSSARHLADIACDQYILLDPNNKGAYIEFADAAKRVSAETAKGYYYYSASDYYWASYNQIDTLQNINDRDIKTLIINSTYDSQSFEADIELWRSSFSGDENITLQVFDDISHFGYKIDTSDQSTLYRQTVFSIEIINAFVEFI